MEKENKQETYDKTQKKERRSVGAEESKMQMKLLRVMGHEW